MRIIGGKLKGRRFSPPAKKWPTRPTTDIAKEALYNILQNRIYFDEQIFLDLFGGTGNHCLEMISRGCTSATYVERFRPCVNYFRELVKEFGIDSDSINIFQSDVFKFLKFPKEKYTLIFAGPPYGLSNLYNLPDIILSSGALADNGLLVVEHNPDHNFENAAKFSFQRNYGQTIFAFFQN